MIIESDLKDILTALGFNKNGNLYEKQFYNFGTSMRVDMSSKKLFYPDAIKGRERNDGFDKPENFVVFECVNRLLEKGYRPEHIELEKEWHLGHDAKSGRADICVVDESNTMLFIIECKTYGKEFEKALKDTKDDGAQLFSYWQQEQSCRWLVLYASDYKNGCIEYEAPTINCTDDANIILLAKKDKSIKLYSDAHTADEKYEVWKETYTNQIYDDLIFSDDSVAYNIGVKPLRKKDLCDFTPEDKIVNKFEEILRHNNVSDKENAFNRLIALFICKLVDESMKGEEDEVEFQYKQGTDTYETLQDRLQKLHKEGMEKFMHEEIFYVDSDYPTRLFSKYTGVKRKKAIEDLQKTIRKLKFYSNNDFAFKDVHNEELFYQNGKILVEMVQLFEKYRIVYPSKHQFLGDMFEQLLNNGFKQNEGQFFTPMPITRFIWDCLPVRRIMNSENVTVYPKVIDYACGAGHFLTEAVETINYFAHSDDNNEWTREHIYGIEKDYRLARVAKISLYMNGAGKGNIIFGDGLENAPDKGIENGSFDILVANPPYSVKYFKQHLQLKNNSFTLLDSIGNDGNEIETLFVERIGQLLKPKGIAAVILPSTILSKNIKSYIGARELIIQNFYIRAIAEFGSETFSKTGTNVVIMFLEKYDEPPKKMDLSLDSVDAIMEDTKLTDWEDKEILDAYSKQIGVKEDIYRKFLSKNYSLEKLDDTEYFKMYKDAFNESKEAKDLVKKQDYKKKDDSGRASSYLEAFYRYTLKIEREKLLYFSLVYRQTTVVITAPADNKGQKEFLGYNWSNRKGNEGIQIISPGGKMYDDENRESESTLASIVRKSFAGAVPLLSEEQKKYASVVNTKDMFDFSRADFDKNLRLNANNSITITSKYDLKSIQDIFPVIESGKRPNGGIGQFSSGILSLGGEHIDNETGYLCLDSPAYVPVEFYESAKKGKIQKNDILICKDGARTGKVAIVRDELINRSAMLNEHVFLLRSDDSTVQYYGFQFLFSEIGQKLLKSYISGSSQGGLNVTNLKQIKIPVPPNDIMVQIVSECKKIDEEYNTTRMSIENYRKKIEELFNELDVISNGGQRQSLANLNKFDVSIGKRVLSTQLVKDAKIPVYSANVNEPFGFVDTLLFSDFSVPSVLWGIDGDWMTRYISKDVAFYPTDHCGVLRCKTDDVNPHYLEHILKKEGAKLGFSRHFRASVERIRGIIFSVADRSTQDKTVAEIEKIEVKIQEEKEKLKLLSNETTDILNKYLN